MPPVPNTMTSSRQPSSIKCTIEGMTVPGTDIMLRLRMGVLAFAKERGWIVTGGWAHHSILGKNGSVYDTRWSCTMGDVDAISQTPLQDLIDLGNKLHIDTGVDMFISRGMLPNLLHLNLNWGGETLVDLLGVSNKTLDSLQVMKVPMTIASGNLSNTSKLVIIDPFRELAQLHSMVDNVFDTQKEENASKYYARIDAIQLALFGPPTPPSVRTDSLVTSMWTPKLCPLHLPHSLHKVALCPYVPGEPTEILAYEVDFFEVVSAVAALNASVVLRIYRPFVWTNVHSMVIEFSSGMSEAVVGLRVYCRCTPIPVSVSLGWRGLRYCTDRTTALHLMTTSMWRISMGDPLGAERRRSAALLLMKHLADTSSSSGTPHATIYAGTRPVRQVFSRNVKRRAEGLDAPPLRIVFGRGQKGSHRRGNSRLAALMDTSGSLASNIIIRDTTSFRKELAQAIKGVLINSAYTDSLAGELQKVLKG